MYVIRKANTIIYTKPLSNLKIKALLLQKVGLAPGIINVFIAVCSWKYLFNVQEKDTC
jgi:hypothetical protein